MKHKVTITLEVELDAESVGAAGALVTKEMEEGIRVMPLLKVMDMNLDIRPRLKRRRFSLFRFRREPNPGNE